MNNSNNSPEINWDNVLSDIHEKLGPAEVDNTQIPQEQPTQEPSPEGNCIFCVRCKTVKLQYPEFPLDPYHLPMAIWIKVNISGRMKANRRCFPCVLTYILQYPEEFSLLDQIIAEKLMHSLQDLTLMPYKCLHENFSKPPDEPKQMPDTTEKPRNIRDILENFKNSNPEV